MMVQIGGNTVSVQVQSSGIGAALTLNIDMAEQVAAAAASATAAETAENGAESAQSAAAASAAAAAATLASAVIKANNGSDFTNAATVRTNLAVVGTAALAASGGSALVGVLQGGTGAVARTAQAKLRAISVSAEDFGAVPDNAAVDSTAAIQAAITYVASVGGGFVDLESANTYYANPVITGNNVWLRWLNNGNASLLGGALRPFDGTKATLTIGDGTTLTRNCGLISPHISGVKIGGNYALVADNCPAALDIKGNVSHLEIHHPDLYGGVVTLRMIPSATKEIVAVKTFGGSLRNDIGNSTSARTIVGQYVNSNGYFNDVIFFGTKINGPGQGRIFEYIGGALFEGHGCYLDMYPGAHCQFTTGGAALFHGCNLDPHGLNEIIIETDAVTNSLNRVVQGDYRHGPQFWKNGSGASQAIPDQANFLAYRGAFQEPWLDRFYVGTSANPFSQAISMIPRTDTGPLDWSGADLSIRNTTESSDLDTAALQTEGGASITKTLRVGGNIEIYGGNATSGGFISSNSASGGLFIGSNQAGQDIQIAAGGGAYVRIRGGAGIRPHVDNTDANGIVGNAWAFSTCFEYRDGAGAKLLGARKTGWSVDTGTAKRTANATYSGTAEVAYTQATVQALMDAVRDLSQTVKALKDDLHATAGHGLIGA